MIMRIIPIHCVKCWVSLSCVFQDSAEGITSDIVCNECVNFSLCNHPHVDSICNGNRRMINVYLKITGWPIIIEDTWPASFLCACSYKKNPLIRLLSFKTSVVVLNEVPKWISYIQPFGIHYLHMQIDACNLKNYK